MHWHPNSNEFGAQKQHNEWKGTARNLFVIVLFLSPILIIVVAVFSISIVYYNHQKNTSLDCVLMIYFICVKLLNRLTSVNYRLLGTRMVSHLHQ